MSEEATGQTTSAGNRISHRGDARRRGFLLAARKSEVMPHRIPRSTVVVIAALLGIVVAVTAFLALRTRASPSSPEAASSRTRDTDARLGEFWAWWASAAPRVAAALDAKDNRSFVEELSSRVHAIDPGLAWETGPGFKGSRHHLTVQPLPAGRPVEALISAVGELSNGAKGEAFALMQGKTPAGEPMVAMVNLALKRVDHLLMDQHVAVTIPLRAPTEQGLPTNEEADELNALEDQLIDVLGRDAIYFGRETGRGLRVIHFQGAGQGPVESRARTWAKQHADRRVSVVSEFDPKWSWFSRW
jgi:hypothetical protein